MEELAGSRAESERMRVSLADATAREDIVCSDFMPSNRFIQSSLGSSDFQMKACVFLSSQLLSSSLRFVDDSVGYFREFLPLLIHFSVSKFEIFTPMQSFVSDGSDQSTCYSDIVDHLEAKHFASSNSQLLQAFVCLDMQVCLLCHYSLPSMLKPLITLFDFAMSRLQCARFAVLSTLDPHAPSINQAVTVSVGAIEVSPLFCLLRVFLFNKFFITFFRATSTQRMNFSDLLSRGQMQIKCSSFSLWNRFCALSPLVKV
jgi:hypothetical protein